MHSFELKMQSIFGRGSAYGAPQTDSWLERGILPIPLLLNDFGVSISARCVPIFYHRFMVTLVNRIRNSFILHLLLHHMGSRDQQSKIIKKEK